MAIESYRTTSPDQRRALARPPAGLIAPLPPPAPLKHPHTARLGRAITRTTHQPPGQARASRDRAAGALRVALRASLRDFHYQIPLFTALIPTISAHPPSSRPYIGTYHSRPLTTAQVATLKPIKAFTAALVSWHTPTTATALASTA